jgi:hypothetical protein
LFFFYFKKLIFKDSLNYFEFWSNLLITVNQMHQHECTSMLLCPMMNFKFEWKNIISLCVHEHKISQLIHFYSISKQTNFRVLHIRLFYFWKKNHYLSHYEIYILISQPYSYEKCMKWNPDF